MGARWAAWLAQRQAKPARNWLGSKAAKTRLKVSCEGIPLGSGRKVARPRALRFSEKGNVVPAFGSSDHRTNSNDHTIKEVMQAGSLDARVFQMGKMLSQRQDRRWFHIAPRQQKSSHFTPSASSPLFRCVDPDSGFWFLVCGKNPSRCFLDLLTRVCYSGHGSYNRLSTGSKRTTRPLVRGSGWESALAWCHLLHKQCHTLYLTSLARYACLTVWTQAPGWCFPGCFLVFGALWNSHPLESAEVFSKTPCTTGY